MLMTKCIVLICGPPACLKSTLVQILRLIVDHKQNISLQILCIKKLRQNEIKFQYNFLSFDDLFSGYETDIIQNESNWKLYRSLIADEIESIIFSKLPDQSSVNLKYSSQILQRLHLSLENLNQNNILIIEDNFYYSSMRHRYRQIAQRAQIGFLSIHLYSDLSIAIQRNDKREISKRVSNVSIENIYSKYEFANEDLIINTTDRGLTADHLNSVLQRIEQACNQPEQQINSIDDEQRRKATEINLQNLIYQTDQKLRKFISKYLKEKLQVINDKKLYAEMINDKRQKFLELIKRRFILVNGTEDVEQIFEQFLQENQ